MPEEGIGVVVLVNDGLLGSMLADMVANAIYDHRLELTGRGQVVTFTFTDGQASKVTYDGVEFERQKTR